MRKIKVVADSSCDIIAIDSVNFSSAPMKIITESREFIDNATLDTEEMADFFSTCKQKSKTACPNVNDWIDAFEDADDVICVTITSALSGSYNTAFAAKNIYEGDDKGKRVFVVDSLSAGPEVSMLVEKIAEYIRDGVCYEDICKKITEYKKHTGLLFMLKSLKNFANNGRVSPIVARLVGIAGICIVGKASDEGTLEPVQKCRGEARSLEAISELLHSLGVKKVSLGHCQNENAAIHLKKLIEEKLENVYVEIHKLRGLCSYYAEKGGLLIGYEKTC